MPRSRAKTSAFEKATRRYEKWLRKRTPVVERDLACKYVKMRKDAFTFFRGTFYRWVELWEEQRKALRQEGVLLPKAPELFCVGDLHLENFGTWRDGEGRLVWGMNDFDEAYPLKYVNDLVRLATSACFALAKSKAAWTLSHQEACGELLSGYGEHLNRGGGAFVLGHATPWLWRIATHPGRSPEEFWTQLAATSLERPGKDLRKAARKAAAALEACAPAGRGVHGHHLCLRQAGVGSLGRPRFVQFYEGRSGEFLREAKATVPSAAVFAGLGKPATDPYRDVIRKAIRVPDPFYVVKDGWVVRRLAFDSGKIELHALDTLHDARSYFRAMGAETANIHLGSDNPGAIARHLAAQCEARPAWLFEASSLMAAATARDFEDFRNSDRGHA